MNSEILALLESSGFRNSGRALKELLAHIRNTTYENIAFDPITITDLERNKLMPLLKRIKAAEPLTKILGHTTFFSYFFYVNQHTLDPRVDSETLILTVHDYIQERNMNFIDLGTGTGCLALTLLLENHDFKATATDISAEALKIARKNAQHHNLENRIQFIKSNSWFGGVGKERFDFIISNPPYINNDYGLDESVINYDPHEALFAGEDGLDCYREILSKARDYLKPGGYIFFEIGFDQRESLSNLVHEINQHHPRKVYQVIGSRKDLGGNDRVVIIQSL